MVALTAAGVLALAGPSLAAPAGQPTQAAAPRQDPLDPADLVAAQIRQERGRPTALLSDGFKAAYEAVTKTEDNLPSSVFAFGYDVPGKVVGVTDLKYEDGDPNRATAKVRIHFTNEDAPVPALDRDTLVAFVRQDGGWRIDDVRLLDVERMPGWKAGREFSVRDSFRKVSPPVDPACATPASRDPGPDRRATAAGFSPLSTAPRADDPNRQTIAEKFVKAVGSACPFGYRLVDLNGDGLSDLVLQLSDRKLGATDAGLRRTVVYALDRQGRWKPVIDGLARGVLVRTDKEGGTEVAFAGGDGYKSWRQEGAAFVPDKE